MPSAGDFYNALYHVITRGKQTFCHSPLGSSHSRVHTARGGSAESRCRGQIYCQLTPHVNTSQPDHVTRRHHYRRCRRRNNSVTHDVRSWVSGIRVPTKGGSLVCLVTGKTSNTGRRRKRTAKTCTPQAPKGTGRSRQNRRSSRRGLCNVNGTASIHTRPRTGKDGSTEPSVQDDQVNTPNRPILNLDFAHSVNDLCTHDLALRRAHNKLTRRQHLRHVLLHRRPSTHRHYDGRGSYNPSSCLFCTYRKPASFFRCRQI